QIVGDVGLDGRAESARAALLRGLSQSSARFRGVALRQFTALAAGFTARSTAWQCDSAHGCRAAADHGDLRCGAVSADANLLTASEPNAVAAAGPIYDQVPALRVRRFIGRSLGRQRVSVKPALNRRVLLILERPVERGT